MAHSLGNMVVSSMMQDYGLTNSVREYIVCNSAVPSEAYAEADDISMRIPELVHADWVDYPTNSWASNWHKLFRDDAGDDRKHLGWPGRFIGVKPYITVVFYSTGDEVLEISDDNGGDIHFWTGMSVSALFAAVLIVHGSMKTNAVGNAGGGGLGRLSMDGRVLLGDRRDDGLGSVTLNRGKL